MRTISRRARVIACAARLCAAAVLLALCLPTAAHAATLAELKAQRTALSRQLDTAGNAYHAADDRLADNQDRIGAIAVSMKRTSAELGREQQQLRSRASAIYRAGRLDYVSVVLGASTFEELLTRIDFVRSIAEVDAVAIGRVKQLRTQLTAESASLKRERSALAANAAVFRAKRDALENDMRAKQAEYARLKASLDATLKSQLARSSGGSGVLALAGANGMVFPVDGPCSYDDTWGAPRSGGRTHKGTDIMASRGTPVVAVKSGTVSSKNGGLGGKTIWLSCAGYDFYYAHLDGWAVTSGSVKAGQLIGYVGNTGNAAGGACHLHFEIHPGGGGAVDPFPYLRAMEH